MPEDALIQYRKEYVVECDADDQDTVHRFDDVVGANDCVRSHLENYAGPYLARTTSEGEFGGKVHWYVDETVPASFFDEMLTEYSDRDRLHDDQSLEDMPVDRGERYLLIEKGRDGGYWLSTGDDAQELVETCDSIAGEYPEDWDIHELWDLVEKRELAVNIRPTIDLD